MGDAQSRNGSRSARSVDRTGLKSLKGSSISLVTGAVR